jgi:hypothetical protein
VIALDVEIETGANGSDDHLEGLADVEADFGFGRFG